jgi:hypothetical protein
MSRRERGNRALVDQLVRELAPPRRPGPFLLVWRWRWELAIAAALIVLRQAVEPDAMLASAGVVVAMCAALPVLRRLVRDRFWCVTIQHRLRAGLQESDVRSWSGRMPAILWTSARPHGEHITLTCPAGVDVARINAARGELASACWAVDVVVGQHPKYANLAVVDVVRRGPPRRQP